MTAGVAADSTAADIAEAFYLLTQAHLKRMSIHERSHCFEALLSFFVPWLILVQGILVFQIFLWS